MSERYDPFCHHPPLSFYPDEVMVAQSSILEIGPGRGDFLFDLARHHPEKTIASIEIKRKRYEKLKPRLDRHGLKNIVLICGDARVVLPRLFERRQLDAIYMLFLDPWPKKRHAKHRLVQPYFVHELYRTLKTGGEVILAHDNDNYLRASCELLVRHAGFRRGDPAGRPDMFQTFYAEKWQQAGRELKSRCFEARTLLRYQFHKLFMRRGKLISN